MISLIAGIPFWAIFVGTVVIIVISFEVGLRIGRLGRVKLKEEETDAPVGAMVGAALGLLAFLLAFTFGLAASRFETRRALVIEDANAIGTAYLRVGLLKLPYRTHMQDLIREYVDVRLQGGKPGHLAEAIVRSDQIQDELWKLTDSAMDKHPGHVLMLMTQSLNEMFDVHSKRIAEVQNRIPAAIWVALYAVTILSMAAVGYHSGIDNTRSMVPIITLALIFSAVIWLIADLDRSNEGSLSVSQQPMLDLQRKLKSTSPEPAVNSPVSVGEIGLNSNSRAR